MITNKEKNVEQVKHVGDALSFGTTLAALAGWLPPLAALASIFWIGFQFYHSGPMKEWRENRKK